MSSYLISLGIGSPADIGKFVTFGLGSAPPVIVPDVVGETQAAGTATLEAEGFVVAVQTAHSSVVPAGTIISQVPTGGTEAANGSTVTITVSLGDETVRPAGKARKRRYYVEIDGQQFEVTGPDHARALFDRARELAASHARELAAKTVPATRKVGKKPVALPTPKITSPDPELREVIREARQAINAVYRQAAIDTELAVLMARKLAEEDEEEALLLLM